MLGLQTFQAKLDGDAAEARERALVDFLVGVAQECHFALASGECLAHRLGLALTNLEPVGAHEAQTFAGGHVGIDADDGDSLLHCGVNAGHQGAGIPADHHHSGRLLRRGLFKGRNQAGNVNRIGAGNDRLDADLFGGELAGPNDHAS